MRNYSSVILGLAVLLLGSCDVEKTKVAEIENYKFELLTQEETGLDFSNVQTQTMEFNIFSYMYFYNGGGIGSGDFNNDGLVDLFFTSNMESNKMFLNQGDMRFKDVTAESGLKGQEGWTTGVSVVDINDDGLLDLYVGQVGEYSVLSGTNQLYICKEIVDGIPVYEDMAKEYGLDLVGFSTQATFFDYDLDGDLDMFQLNHSLHHNGTFGQRKGFEGEKHPLAGDRLFRNDEGKYVEVTETSGINSTRVGYGLGIVTGDINNDGLPDIYIGNDFHENDYLYINQGDGTFRDVVPEQMMHTSRFSMGVEMGDINNDGYEEIISLDMLPDDPVILKSSLGEDAYGIFQFKLGYGYNHQFARNSLQLNNGDNTFSEIGLFANVSASDWSWAPLFLDFDQDGYKDLFISNGIPRRMNDIDYVNFRRGDEDTRWKTNTNYLEENDLEIVERMPQIKLSNKFYQNHQDLTFTDVEDLVKGNLPTYSNGAVYADLDNDGDLDIVVNNIDEEPYIYRNLVEKDSTNNAILLDLKGPKGNRNAIGSRIWVFKGDQKISTQHYPVRGYQSSMQGNIHMGVGESADSVWVVWPDQTYSSIDPVYNQTLEVEWSSDLPKFKGFTSDSEETSLTWEEVTAQVGLDIEHKENPFVEFNREILIPHMVSREGPALAIGDINKDGLDDLFFGASKRDPGFVYIQTKAGRFIRTENDLIENDSIFEDVDASLIDLDNDNDLDLVVASGGNEYWGESEYLLQRIYLNDGNGSFTERITIPGSRMTAACVISTDLDNDGLPELFFGGRAVPWNYGVIPESKLYRNLGEGRFEDVTDNWSKDLGKIGLVKDAEWSDIDQDGDEDLILALEWGTVTIMKNEGSSFEKVEIGKEKGWWNFAQTLDVDGDGDLDVLAGNIGRNSKFKPTEEEPLRLYVKDFDENGSVDPILTYYLKGREIPFSNYMELTKQLVTLKKKYLYSKDLANSSMEEIFGKEALAEADVLEANFLESVYYENKGDWQFETHVLPDEVQFSTLQSAFPIDDDQGILLGGNFYDCNIEMGRYDASYGQIMKSLENGGFEITPIGDIRIKGQVKDLQSIEVNGETHYIFIRNNDLPIILKNG